MEKEQLYLHISDALKNKKIKLKKVKKQINENAKFT
jgi:hypothetical protein